MKDEQNRAQGGLIRSSGTRDLTTGSARLIRRGLDAAAPVSQQPRVVSFPENRSMGKLYLLDTIKPFDWIEIEIEWRNRTLLRCLPYRDLGSPGNGEFLSEARGQVTIPAGKKLGLRISWNCEEHRDLSLLSSLKPDDLQVVDNSDQDCACFRHHYESLAFLQKLTGLQELNLRMNFLPGAVLEYLQEMTSLQALDFSLNSPEPEDLIYLGQLTSLRWLNLAVSVDFDVKWHELLGNLTALEHLILDYPLEEDETAKLRAVLPNCKVQVVK
jgi:hypothetical protein